MYDRRAKSGIGRDGEGDRKWKNSFLLLSLSFFSLLCYWCNVFFSLLYCLSTLLKVFESCVMLLLTSGQKHYELTFLLFLVVIGYVEREEYRRRKKRRRQRRKKKRKMKKRKKSGPVPMACMMQRDT